MDCFWIKSIMNLQIINKLLIELEDEFWDKLFEKYHRGKKITEEDREKFAAFKKRIVMAHSTPPPSLIHSHKKNISEPKESKDD